MKTDLLGFPYVEGEPAFTATASGQHYYHLRTKKLYLRLEFDRWLETMGKGFADGELGIPTDDLIEIREDMLENLYTPEVPTAPSGLTVTATEVGELDLEWTDESSNEAGFLIQHSVDDIEYFDIGSVAKGVETFTDKGLFADTLYYYKVWAVNVTGPSDTAATGSGTTLGGS